MNRGRRQLLQLAAAAPAILAGCKPRDPIEVAIDRIWPLARRLGPVQAGDWLETHREPGQTYAEFRKTVRSRAVDAYKMIRIVPIGTLTAGQRAVLDLTTDFIHPFFGLPLQVDPPVALDTIPAEAQRQNIFAGQAFEDAGQLLTPYLLNHVLKPRRQGSDAAVLGITAKDLWPGAGWNFVFGQASLTERVGIWSMARNGDPDESPGMRQLCSLRTVLTATHEIGHMFGIRHCIAWTCGMNGSNHLAERDRKPLEFCPECQPKLWWTLGLDPLERSRALETTARRYGFEADAELLAAQTRALAG
jgi:archaemetzincin